MLLALLIGFAASTHDATEWLASSEAVPGAEGELLINEELAGIGVQVLRTDGDAGYGLPGGMWFVLHVFGGPGLVGQFDGEGFVLLVNRFVLGEGQLDAEISNSGLVTEKFVDEELESVVIGSQIDGLAGQFVEVFGRGWMPILAT